MSGKQTERLLADPSGIVRAAEILLSGGLVAVPTETVYGLAGRADREEAVAAIYRAKGRPDFNPLIVHVASLERAETLGTFSSTSVHLAAEFWPGPLTLVVPLKPDTGITAAVTAGLPTVALRVPAHPTMQALLTRLDVPVAAPSANRSGAVSPTTADHVLATLGGRIDAVLDGGPTAQGIESTIVAPRDNGLWHLLRPGPVPEEQLTTIMGPASPLPHSRIEAPGQLASHYSPGKPVRLDALEADPDEFLIGFGELQGDCNLSRSRDLEQAAARLYACLHEAAASSKARVAVAPIPNRGIGAAINDRLRRAAI